MGLTSSHLPCRNPLEDFEHVNSVKVQSLPIKFDSLASSLVRVGDGTYQIPPEMNKIPDGAIYVGSDTGFRNIYVGRIWNNGDLIPGKIIAETQCCTISQKRKVIDFLAQNKCDFEYLTVDCEVDWIPSANGVIPNNAVAAGYYEIFNHNLIMKFKKQQSKYEFFF